MYKTYIVCYYLLYMETYTIMFGQKYNTRLFILRLYNFSFFFSSFFTIYLCKYFTRAYLILLKITKFISYILLWLLIN